VASSRKCSKTAAGITTATTTTTTATATTTTTTTTPLTVDYYFDSVLNFGLIRR